MPAALNPDRGYVLTANNDPGNLGVDGSLTNDEWYIGGPWDVGFRADTINRELERAVAEGEADIARMAHIQANHDSRLGELFTDRLLDGIAQARQLAAGGATSESEVRTAALYDAEQAAIDEVEQRLAAWRDAGFKARSGVKTFYAEPDDQDRSDAVATTLFNAWFGHFIRAVFDDEELPGVWKPGGNDGRLRALNRLLDGRGAGNPMSLASFNPATGESAFFDVLDTPEVETSVELMLASLLDALTFLRSEPEDDATGGFGTTDMSTWLWGLRHVVKFESLVGDFLGPDSGFDAITTRFAITTAVLGLDDDIGAGDPRAKLKWFPRDGDQDNVDAGNPGLSGTSFSYGSGPVMRMVVAFDGDRMVGQNILPGGQSGLIESPYFSDQARLWLANDTHPMRLAPVDVAEGATGRETYLP
jgi:penicillin amidase